MENKLNITEGNVFTDGWHIMVEKTSKTGQGYSEHIASVMGAGFEYGDSNTSLYVDAHNTYLNNPVLPSELLKQRDELLKAAKHLLVNLDARTKNVEHKDWLNTFFKKEIELLKSIENE